MARYVGVALVSMALVAVVGCTQEQQNKIGREIQNWTGTNGVLEVYAGDKLVRRFIKIDKLTTAMGTAMFASICDVRYASLWRFCCEK